MCEAYAEIIKALPIDIYHLFARVIVEYIMGSFIWEDLLYYGLFPCWRGTCEQICLIPYDWFSHIHEITQAIGG